MIAEPAMTPPLAATTLDAFYLEARCRLLDLAAILDRLDRGAGTVSGDARVTRLRQGVEVLLAENPGRAEAVQKLFSLDYDPAWPKPVPKG
jgi:hypothetical protein